MTLDIALGTYGQANHDLAMSKQAERNASPSQDHLLKWNKPPQASCCIDVADDAVSDGAHGNVGLSGNVISATFTVPYTLRYRKGEPWVCCAIIAEVYIYAVANFDQEPKFHHHRSPNIDSLAYLSSRQSPWNHTLVAWTGEIGHVPDNTVTSSGETPVAMPFSASIALDEAVLNKTTSPEDVFVTHEDINRLEQQLYRDDIRTIPIWLADDDDVTDEGIKLVRQSRWRRYAERDLCALFHYKQHPPTSEYKEIKWKDYHSMNKAFADKICDIYKPGDVIIVHDYYLTLLPRMLRQRLPNIHVAFFLASPFPTSELVRCLSRRKEILEGMLGSDVIGFATTRYLCHFADSCTRILNYPADRNVIESPVSKVHLDIFLVGIDISKTMSLAYADSVRDKCTELQELYLGKKIIVGYDPLDRLGGVDKKLQAFGRFLECYPCWRDKVVLIQITATERKEDDDGDESTYVTKVNDLASSINGTYGSLGYTPVHISARQLSQDEYFALLRIGDVALNTCIREGISITNLEYIACQRGTWGVPIISEFSGMASSMEEATCINPWDLNGVADQIHAALALSEERKRTQYDALFARVVEGDAAAWAISLLRRLGEVIQGRT